jgi:hypothetical protein
MPASYEVRSGERLIVCTLTGELSLADRVGLIDGVQREFREHGPLDCIVDNRGQIGAASKQDLERVLPLVRKVLAEVAGSVRVAIVVGEDVQYGVGRMVQIQLDDIPNLDLRVFRDMGEARCWLGGAGGA